MVRFTLPDANRVVLWTDAWACIKDRLASPKFLYGTFSDRQTGALETHRYRTERGFNWVAPGDHAGLHTKGSDGRSRYSMWTRSEAKGRQLFAPVVEVIRAGEYEPEPLKIVRWEEERNGRKKERTIAVPSVIDRTLQAVSLEVLEPILDPVLSDWQQGYRASSVAGEQMGVRGFRGVARGDIRIVGLRLKRALGEGFGWLGEVDINNAFPSVPRDLLKLALVADGCPAEFADFLIQMMGDKAVDEGKQVKVGGIPLGCPYGPLLFNFYIQRVHDRLPSTRDGLRLVSYADNFFAATMSEDDLDEAIRELQAVLEDLGLKSKIEQRWSADMNEPFFVLSGKKQGGFYLHLGDDRKVVLRGLKGSKEVRP